MRITPLLRPAAAATAIFAAALIYSGTDSVAAKTMKPAKPAGATAPSGKALLTTYRCNGCHGADLAGRPGFAPSIRKTGALHDYTQAQFVTLMHTGMKNDGSHVRPPMPTFAKMPTPQAVSIFGYLETLK